MSFDLTDLANDNGQLVAVDRRTPIDGIEPIEETADMVRDARMQAVRLLNQFASRLETALSHPDATLKGIRTTLWGLCFGLGLNVCSGHSVTAMAGHLGVSKATLSKIATCFTAATGLAPSSYLKTETSRLSYAKARRRSVQLNGQADD